MVFLDLEEDAIQNVYNDQDNVLLGVFMRFSHTQHVMSKINLMDIHAEKRYIFS